MTSTRWMKYVVIFCCWILSALEPASACTYPPPPTFEAVAPKAKHIFVFQVLQLEYRQVQEGAGYSEWIEGKVRVVETFRGTPKFTRIHFFNGWCGGVRLDVGRSYLSSTNESGDTLYLEPADRTVIDISFEYNPSRPDAVATSRLLQKLLRALEGKGSFRDVPNPTYYELTRTVPGPPDCAVCSPERF